MVQRLGSVNRLFSKFSLSTAHSENWLHSHFIALTIHQKRFVSSGNENFIRFFSSDNSQMFFMNIHRNWN